MPAHASPGEHGASGRTATQANAAGGTAFIGAVPKFRWPGRWRDVRSVRAVRAAVGTGAARVGGLFRAAGAGTPVGQAHGRGIHAVRPDRGGAAERDGERLAGRRGNLAAGRVDRGRRADRAGLVHRLRHGALSPPEPDRRRPSGTGRARRPGLRGRAALPFDQRAGIRGGVAVVRQRQPRRDSAVGGRTQRPHQHRQTRRE